MNKNSQKKLSKEDLEAWRFSEKYYGDLLACDLEREQIAVPSLILEFLSEDFKRYKVVKEIYNNNLYLFTSLCRKATFSVVIDIIRKNFNIPDGGFGNISGDNKEVEYSLEKWKKWSEEFDIDFFFERKKESFENFLVLHHHNYLSKKARNEFNRIKNEWHKISKKYIQAGLPGVEKEKWRFCIDDLLNVEVEKLIQIFHLPYNFLPYIKKYVVFNVIDAPASKWRFVLEKNDSPIEFTPRGKIVRDFNSSDHIKEIKWINTKIYTPLTKEEINILNMDLEKISEYYFPVEISYEPKHYKDPLLYTKISEEMSERTKETKVEYTGYLNFLSKKAKTSEDYAREFEKQKKKRPQEIEKKTNKYTSNDVAVKLLGSSKYASRVRKINQREKGKSYDRFFNGIRPNLKGKNNHKKGKK